MAKAPQKSPPNSGQRGTTALEVAIFTIAGLVVATIATVTMLTASFGVTDSGQSTARDGVNRASGALELRPGVMVVRGDVDVDGNGSIDLGGVDQRAITKIEFTLTTPTGGLIDLSAPYAADDAGTDPDSTSNSPSTLISVITGAWQVSESVWSVEILGGDSDNFLEEGERANVTVWLHQYDWANALFTLGSGSSDPWIDTAAELLQAGDRFSIRVVVRKGTGIEFERILPIELTQRTLVD